MNSAVASLRVTSGSRPSCVLWPPWSWSGASRTTGSIRRPGLKPPRNNNSHVYLNGQRKPIVVKCQYMKVYDEYTDLDIDRRRKGIQSRGVEEHQDCGGPVVCGWRNDLVPSGVVLLNHRPGHAATARQLNLVRRSPRSDRFQVDASGTLRLTTTPDADLLSGLDPLLHVATELLSVTAA